jgi:UDP:flavonoid glycosyltransferase YjiC (YdhE family)
LNGTFSGLAQVAQLPAALELPGRRLPAGFHHTGPWTDAAGREPVDFPCERLDPSRRLVYASMGTLQNGVLETFRMMAEACAGLDMQLVISLGGGQDPALLGDLPDDAIVVGYDQPGVGTRVEWSGVGRSIPFGRLTVGRLRDAVRLVLGNPAYRERAGRLQSSIEAADGLNRAADLIVRPHGSP